MLDMNNQCCDDLSLKDRVAMLNNDQRRIFEKVEAHLLHQQKHEQSACLCEFKPLQMFISGIGGTGKFFLIEEIKALINSIWRLDALTCAVSAPTGLAAFNVGGITMHRLLQLPIEYTGKSTSY